MITVVDNASSDGSAVSLQSYYGNRANVDIRLNESNPGFAPAVNSVAREADTDLILILNPDCILGRDALSRLKSALEDDDRAGLPQRRRFLHRGFRQRR